MRKFARLRLCFFLCLFSVGSFATSWNRTEDWGVKETEENKWYPFITLDAQDKNSPISQVGIYVNPQWGRFANKFAKNKTQDEHDDECLCIITNYIGIAVNARDTDVENRLRKIIKPFEDKTYERAIYSKEMTIPNIWYRNNRPWRNKSSSNNTIRSPYNWRRGQIEEYEIEKAHVVVLNSTKPLRLSVSINANSHFFLNYILTEIQKEFFADSEDTSEAFASAYAVVNELVPVGKSNSDDMQKHPEVSLDAYERDCRDFKLPCYDTCVLRNCSANDTQCLQSCINTGTQSPTSFNLTGAPTTAPTISPTSSTVAPSLGWVMIPVGSASFLVMAFVAYYYCSHTPEEPGYMVLNQS